MNPITEQQLRAELHGDEGVRLKVYDDATGLPITAGNQLQGRVNLSASTITLIQWTPPTGALATVPLLASCAGLFISGQYPTF